MSAIQPQAQAPAYAPEILPPLEKPKSKADQPELELDLKAYLKRIFEKFEAIARLSRYSRYYTWTKAELYWRGEQLIWLNPSSQQFEAMDEEDTELYFINNIMGTYVEQVAAEYAKSSPKLVPYSENGDDEKIQAALSGAEHIIDCLRDTLWSPEDLQREAKLIQFRSCVFTRTWKDMEDGPWIEEPQMGDQQTSLAGGVDVQYQTAVGKQRKRAGRIRSDAIDPLLVGILDRACTVEDSPYLVYEHVDLKSRVRKLYPNFEIGKDSQDKSSFNTISGIAFKRQLETASSMGEADATRSSWGGTSYYGTDSAIDELSCRHTEVYFEPYVYDEYVTIQDEELPGGMGTIPRGSRLADVFDKGVKFCLVNGEFAMIYNLAKNDEWSGYKYMVSGSGFYGVGSENLLAQQDWFNEMGSMVISAMIYASNGITVADMSRIKNGNQINRPGTIVSIQDRLPGEKLTEFLQHYHTQGLDPSVMGMMSFLKESMQFSSAARDYNTSGEAGPGMQTATGVNYQNAVANAYSGVRLELRAHNLARRMEQALKIITETETQPRYWAKFGQTKGRYLSGLDIGTEIRVRVEPDTHQPKTNEDSRRDTAAAMQLGWGSGQLPPFVERYVGRIFNMPTDPEHFDEWSIIAQTRLDGMKQTAQIARSMMQQRGIPEQQGAPFVIAQCVQVAAPDPLDNDAAIIEHYTEFWISDEGQHLDPIMNAALHSIIQMQEQAGMVKASQALMKQAAVAEPVEDAQMAKQNASEEGKADQQAARDEHKAGNQSIRDEQKARFDHGRNIDLAGQKQMLKQPVK